MNSSCFLSRLGLRRPCYLRHWGAKYSILLIQILIVSNMLEHTCKRLYIRVILQSTWSFNHVNQTRIAVPGKLKKYVNSLNMKIEQPTPTTYIQHTSKLNKGAYDINLRNGMVSSIKSISGSTSRRSRPLSLNRKTIGLIKSISGSTSRTCIRLLNLLSTFRQENT